ncbi:MAG: ATP-binding protein [Nocardioidaceae bacterium]
MAVAADAGISVSIVRDPALVRTVRLIAAAVARRTGQDEEFVEEIRLAVGEACALMLADDSVVPDPAAAGPVTVAMTIGDRLVVDVVSQTAVPVTDEPHSDIDGVEPWALLRGLIEDFTVTQDEAGTRLSMSWPLA